MNTVSEMICFIVKDFYKGNEYLISKYYLKGRSIKKDIVQKTFDAYKQARTTEEKRWVLQQVKLAK